MLKIIWILLLASTAVAAQEDLYLWLEEIEGERALDWVREQNKRSLAELEALPTFQPLFERNLEIYNSEERIANPSYSGEFLYNFWRDEKNERGLWRRTTPAGFEKDNPDWETVLDVDALAQAEGENWVWKGASCLYPEDRLCIVALSHGGAYVVANIRGCSSPLQPATTASTRPMRERWLPG